MLVESQGRDGKTNRGLPFPLHAGKVLPCQGRPSLGKARNEQARENMMNDKWKVKGGDASLLPPGFLVGWFDSWILLS
jgi:hypothetical protein